MEMMVQLLRELRCRLGNPSVMPTQGKQAMKKVQDHLPVHQDWQASCAKAQDEHKACSSSWAQVRPR